MKKISFLLLMAIPVYAGADVFKCVIAEQKTVYQALPCPEATISQQTIAIKKIDPAKEAETEAQLEAWEQEQATKEEAERNAEQERQEALDRQANIDALDRNTAAQQDAAAAARQPVIVTQPIWVNPHALPRSSSRQPSIGPAPDRGNKPMTPYRKERMN